MRNEEWGGLFLDVLDQQIVDKSVINVLLKPLAHEVSCRDMKSCQYYKYVLIQTQGPDEQPSMKSTVAVQPSVGLSVSIIL